MRLLRETMEHGKLATSDAAILLSVVYGRERYFEYARTLLRSLVEYFPRNPMLRLEMAHSYRREGRPQEALEIYAEVAQAMEAGRPGYDKLPRDRLWYQVGSLYQEQHQLKEALDAYEHVTERDGSDGLVKAYCKLRRGEIFAARGRNELAREEYQQVVALPYEEPRRLAQERLRTLPN